MTTKKPRGKKYLNNADLLREIHTSKMSYCYLMDDCFSMYDYIVFDVSEIDDEIIDKAKQLRLKRLNNEILENIRKEKNFTPKKCREYALDNGLYVESIPNDEIVIRVITNEHVPVLENGKKVRTIFEPFKHYIIESDSNPVEVARSHWKGNLNTGEFNQTHGRLTNELGKMFIKLAEHYSFKTNFRNYTYLDEMMGEARIQLVKNALLFNESILYKKEKAAVQLNPFAYYTSFVTNAFRSVLNTEKQVRNIRDDLLEMHGMDPSFTRQIEIEMNMLEGKNKNA